MYGDYMASHNVSPEKRPNRPDKKQVMDQARRVAETKKKQDAKSLRRLLKQAEHDPTKKEERALLWQAAEGLSSGQMSGRPPLKSHRKLGSYSSQAAAAPLVHATQVVQPVSSPLYEPAVSAISAAAADERALAQSHPLSVSQRVTGSQGVFPSSQTA